jgi:mono/diheme cytochrome c family protein
VPNITQKGLSNWSQEQIAKLLETGDMPDGDSIGGNMGKVVGNTRQLSDADRNAMAVYLKSLPPVEGPKRPESK